MRAGADSLLVLTGVTRPADVLLAPPQRRPAYIAADLSGLNAAHPEVAPQDGAFRCGGWIAAAAGAVDGAVAGDDRWLTVSGSGDWMDGLRALCAAAWTAGPPPGDPAEQRKAAASAVAAVNPDEH